MPVWLRRMASRRSTSIAACASWPASIVALDDARRRGGAGRAGRRWCRAPRRVPVVGRDRAGVADLAAGLGVERRAVEEDLDRSPSSRRGSDRHDGQDAHVAVVVAVADELGGAELLDELAVALDAVVVDAARPCGPPWPAGAARPSRRRSRRGRRSTPRSAVISVGDLEREAEGVVELERGRAGQRPSRPSDSSSSRMARPVRSVWRKRSSSRVMTPAMKSRFLTRSG